MNEEHHYLRRPNFGRVTMTMKYRHLPLDGYLNKILLYLQRLEIIMLLSQCRLNIEIITLLTLKSTQLELPNLSK